MLKIKVYQDKNKTTKWKIRVEDQKYYHYVLVSVKNFQIFSINTAYFEKKSKKSDLNQKKSDFNQKNRFFLFFSKKITNCQPCL